MDILIVPYFHICCELALETSAKDFLYTPTLISELSASGLSNQWAFLLTENCLQCQKWNPYKRRGMILQLNVLKRREIAQPVLATTANQENGHAHGTPCLNPPTSLYPSQFLSHQSLINYKWGKINGKKVGNRDSSFICEDNWETTKVDTEDVHGWLN